MIAYSCAPRGRSVHVTLCGVRGDGSRARQVLTVGPTEAGAPSLSPDGVRAAYALAQGGGYELTNDGVYLANQHGGSTRKIWSPPRTPPSDRNEYFGLPSSPAWSPDGRELAITEPTADPRYNNEDCDLWVIAISGHGAHRVTDGSGQAVHCAVPSVSWSPDGKRLAYIATNRAGAAQGGGDEVMTVPATGGPSVLLGRQPSQILTSVAWSPDGKAIAVVAEGTDVVGQPVPDYPGTRLGDDPDIIELFAATDRRPPATIVHTPPSSTQITTLGSVAWSPDGTRIAFGRRSAHVTAKTDPGNAPLPEVQAYAHDVVTTTPDGVAQTIVAADASEGATGRGADVTSWVKAAN